MSKAIHLERKHWLVEAWRAGSLRQVVRVFAPVTLVLLVSLAVFGLWPLNMLKATEFTTYWNASLWPYSIPVGLVLTVAAIAPRAATPWLPHPAYPRTSFSTPGPGL